MSTPSIRDLNLEGRCVFMRLDLNVPLAEGRITSDARIIAALPTVKHAIKAGARLALASHLGRPKGQRVPEMSLEPVAARLSELLDQQVVLADDCIGDGVKALVNNLKPGEVLLLENLRYHKGEKKNDPEFVKALAAPFEVYVNDAFGACHREHASIVGVPTVAKEKGAGFLLEKEVAAIGKLLDAPEKPFAAVIGGAKVADKLGVLESLVPRVNSLCIGGAMAYTFLKAQGYEIGTSRCEEEKLAAARQLLERAKGRDVEVILPVDHVVADELDKNAVAEVVDDVSIPDGKMALDIGPKTRELVTKKLEASKTIFWNGPMGVFEWAQFAEGTKAVAEVAANSPGYTVVGGGDSVAAIEAAGVKDKIDHVSTGGGASLELLQYGNLPGIKILGQ